MFDYKTENVISSHSFISYEISVITMSDKEGSMYKGLAVSPVPLGLFEEAVYSEAMGDHGKPIVLDSKQALLFCTFINEVLDGKLPRKILIHSSGPLLRIKLVKYIEKWHGGGGYKGSVAFGRSISFGIILNATITKNSLIKLKESLVELYALDAKQAGVEKKFL